MLKEVRNRKHIKKNMVKLGRRRCVAANAQLVAHRRTHNWRFWICFPMAFHASICRFPTNLLKKLALI